MYVGEYHGAVDSKGRLALPLAIKSTMEKYSHNIWHITRGYDTTLFMFEASYWEELSKVIPKPSLRPDELDFRRYLIGSCSKVRVDSAGRILIPQHLRHWADIDRGAALIGMEDHIEIWNELRWKQFCDRNVENFKKIGAELFGNSRNNAIQQKEDISNAQHLAG